MLAQNSSYPYTLLHRTLGISMFHISVQYERNKSEHVTPQTSRPVEITKHFSAKLQVRDKGAGLGISCVKCETFRVEKLLLLLLLMMMMTATRLTHWTHN